MKRIFNVCVRAGRASLAILAIFIFLGVCFGADPAVPPTGSDQVSHETQGSSSTTADPGVVFTDGPRGATDPTNLLFAGVINALSAKYGWLAAVFVWMGILRTALKPVTTAVEKFVRESETTRDDEVLAAVEHSKAWIVFCWLLDFLASVKVGPQFTAAAQGPVDPRADGYVPAGNGSRGATNPTIVLLLGALVLFSSGCKFEEKLQEAALKPQITIITNTVEKVITNNVPVAVPIAVPGETRIVTNIVERISTNQVIETITRTNWVTKEAIAEGLQTAKAGAAVAGTFNPGAGAIAAAGLGVLSAGLGLLAARKNKDAKASTQQLTAVIKGVEDFTNGFDQDAGAKAKAAIEAASKELGVSDALHATVKDLTEAKI